VPLEAARGASAASALHLSTSGDSHIEDSGLGVDDSDDDDDDNDHDGDIELELDVEVEAVREAPGARAGEAHSTTQRVIGVCAFLRAIAAIVDEATDISTGRASSGAGGALGGASSAPHS